MTTQAFTIHFNKYVLYGDTFKNRCRTLVLHGAGRSSRDRFSRLRNALNNRGIPSAGFDFIGHGQTGGCIEDTSLQLRTEQAAAVIRNACKEPLTLIGASMSAYTAIQLTTLFEVENLILLVPAVYTPNAYRLAFGPQFSAAIRVPESWQDSDAFEILKAFQGNLLVIAAEHDEVIPARIPQMIHDAGKNAETNRLYTVPGSGHLSLFPRVKDFHHVVNMIGASAVT